MTPSRLLGLTRPLSLLAAGLVWELVTRRAELLYFPPPSAIALRGFHMWLSGPPAHAFLTDQTVANLLPSLARLAIGWTLAAVVGVTAGLALGRLPVLAAVLGPLLHIGRSIPPTALLPLILAIFIIGTPVQLAAISYGVTWPVLINAMDGARAVERAYLDTAAVFQLRPLDRLLQVIVPAAAPQIFAGLRLSTSLALIMMIVSELTASTEGLGYLLQEAASALDITAMWAVLVLLGLLGYALNAIFLRIQHRHQHLLRPGQDVFSRTRRRPQPPPLSRSLPRQGEPQ
ncbi:ABC transporter permease subunit [Nonomuraea sp. NPDC026600]|uniref:ABC transporter permease n=1 Tax=Nonomuraea sp. NPDC026600 TaxID=3155363 RepID=UPI0033DAC2B6